MTAHDVFPVVISFGFGFVAGAVIVAISAERAVKRAMHEAFDDVRRSP